MISELPSNWSMKKIGEIGKVIGGGTPSTKNEFYYGGNIPWITPKDLSNYNYIFIERGERNITKLGLENSSARLMPEGTVLFSSRAPIGYVAIAKNEISTNQGFKSIVCNEKIVDNKFIYYSMKFYKEAIENVAAGSTFKEVSGKVLKEFEIPIPPLKEQKGISKILFSLDSKIELNQKMNRTLEKIGQAIFKHWFIDFEFPDENGKPYKSNGGEMVDSELGKIPQDWTVVKIGDLIELVYGKGLTKNKRKSGKIPVYGSNGITDYHNEAFVNGPGLIIGRKGTVGKINISYTDFWPIDTTYFVRSKIDSIMIFWYYLLNSLNLDKMNVHSAVPGLNRNDVYEILIAIPNDNLFSKIEAILKSLHDKINQNQIENSNLESIRDSLLPKLMSGKIRLEELKNEPLD